MPPAVMLDTQIPYSKFETSSCCRYCGALLSLMLVTRALSRRAAVARPISIVARASPACRPTCTAARHPLPTQRLALCGDTRQLHAATSRAMPANTRRSVAVNASLSLGVIAVGACFLPLTVAFPRSLCVLRAACALRAARDCAARGRHAGRGVSVERKAVAHTPASNVLLHSRPRSCRYIHRHNAARLARCCRGGAAGLAPGRSGA